MNIMHSFSSSLFLVKQYDNDRYLCTLFAKEKTRETLFALYAFNYEIAKIRETVTEPMMGFIRLQWWREAIEEAYNGQVRHHEVLQNLAPFIKGNLAAKEGLLRMLSGREHDLDETPPATLEALEAYMVDTSSSLFQLALDAVGVTSKDAHHAAHHIGIAWGLVGYLRAVRFYSASKRVLFPEDMLQEAGITATDIINGRSLEKTITPVQSLLAQAKSHLQTARSLQPSIPKEASTVLLPATIATIIIKRIEQCKWQIFHTDLEKNRLIIQLSVLKQAWKGQF